MEPTLLRGFPGVSVTLKNVLLRDSLFLKHKQDLVRSEEINVSLNILALLRGNTDINRIVLRNAAINLFTDSNGYSNTSMFNSGKQQKAQAGETPDMQVRNIEFENVRFIVDNRYRHKKFDFLLNTVKGRIKYPGTGFKGTLQINTLVNSFAFNTKRGSFLKDKVINGTLNFEFNKEAKKLIINQKPLKIGEDKFNIGAQVDIQKNAFGIDIEAGNILFTNLANLLAPNISTKLMKFSIDKGINVKGRISEDGKGSGKDPLINVTIAVNNSNVRIPSGMLNNATFNGRFTNQRMPGFAIGDENSAIYFTKLKADYYNAPITIDTFYIHNLSRPIAVGRVRSSFPLKNLNGSVNNQLVALNSGNAVLDLYCRADIENFQLTKPTLNGNVKITDADISYLPRKIRLVKSALTLNFTDKDLNISNSRFQLGNSVLNMSCTINNFLNLYYTSPEKILVDLRMSSPQLYLNDFLPILSPRSKVSRSKPSGNTIKEFTEQLGTVLEQSRMNIQLNVQKAIYKKFTASNLKAKISLVGTNVNLENISVAHAGG
ncbi:MAG: AsmA family protein, partial [Sphingobacteriales bacterium]